MGSRTQIKELVLNRKRGTSSSDYFRKKERRIHAYGDMFHV